MWIFDAHLDLSYNAMTYNRDLRAVIPTIRDGEKELTDLRGRGAGTVSFPAMRAGKIRFCVATLLAPCRRKENTVVGWASPEQAWAQLHGQLEWYRQMELAGDISIIHDSHSLNKFLKTDTERTAADAPIGVLLSLEGADPIIRIPDLEKLVHAGLRALGPAHYGQGRYAAGTDAFGPFPPQGLQLLDTMDELNLILDVTHLSDPCFWQALDRFAGPIWASHSNCRALIDHNRQFADDQIMALIEREAVIGVALDAWMLSPNWIRDVSTPESTNTSLDNVVDQIDHICQLAGNSKHVGIGSDLDGGFGAEQAPLDVNTIADLQKLQPKLNARGYSDSDIEAIFNGNFTRQLKAALRR